MRIAVSSQNFKTITGHAGKTRRFLIYEAESGSEPTEIERLDLPKELSLHEYRGTDHPLYQRGLSAIVTASAGPRFVERMQEQGINVITTAESDVGEALKAIAAGKPLPPAAPHEH